MMAGCGTLSPPWPPQVLHAGGAEFETVGFARSEPESMSKLGLNVKTKGMMFEAGQEHGE